MATATKTRNKKRKAPSTRTSRTSPAAKVVASRLLYVHEHVRLGDPETVDAAILRLAALLDEMTFTHGKKTLTVAELYEDVVQVYEEQAAANFSCDEYPAQPARWSKLARKSKPVDVF